jgi:hypothetical protein
MGADAGSNIAIEWKSIELTPMKFGEISGNQRILVSYLWINYETDTDFTLELQYIKAGSDTVNTLTYTIDKDNVFQKIRLPIGILINRCWLRITGSISDHLEIVSMGFLFDVKPIGKR